VHVHAGQRDAAIRPDVLCRTILDSGAYPSRPDGSDRPAPALPTRPTPFAALVPVAALFTNTERLALAGFLAAYSGLTRQAYELDLRQFAD
jgi:hypothetical protein